jgi:hypothetical protein
MNEELRAKLSRELEDLGSRLYYCSNSGEGRKVRRELEKSIRAIERELRMLEV